MPSLQPGDKVLVTGASGYIAVWVVKYLLDSGFHVRGTVRSVEKGEYLRTLFKQHGDRFEFVVVEDIAAEGAFDEAVKGMDAIEHTASPFHFKSEDPDDLIKPAVNGTKNILESALRYSTSLKRVVILASVACVIEPVPEGQRVFTEKDWNRFSVKEVEQKGKNALPVHKYRVSKLLAEQAAWKFIETNRDKISWDLVAINPPFVWGPPLHHIPRVESLNTSLVDFYELITGKMEATAIHRGNWTDVRDVAEAHVKVLTTPEAGGERFLISSGPYCWQDVLDAVHADSGENSQIFSAVPRGNPGAGRGLLHGALTDTTKAKNILGLKFREMNETAKETAKDLLSRQW